jgi:GWxTD domain-containing protein
MNRWILSAVAAIFLAGPLPAAAPKLAKTYQDWLNGPVSLILTRTERTVFLNLTSDVQRDRFIDHFWAIRNPHPGAESNDFKDEFYRRVAYVNAHFGPDSGTVDGWRTDMGKTWVLFGKPQLSRDYRSDPQIKAIQLWFYANPGLAELPPFFYVLFFDRNDIGGYRLYYPYSDGPQALVRDGATGQQAYETMRQVSAELAHASLSLIPGEPVDTDNFSGSMASASIINAIQGYREMPSYTALISAREAQLAHVTSRIHYDLPQADLAALVAFDRGQPWLHWQLELNEPAGASAARVAYRVQSTLLSNTRLVFERTDTPAITVPDASSRGPFLYQDRMPVVPGSYQLRVTAENTASGRRYQAVKDFTVAGGGEGTGLSDVLVVGRYEREPRVRPFTFAGVKFEPSPGGQARASKGLAVLYQVRMLDPRPAELKVEYVLGNIATKFRRTFEDKLDPRKADASGELLTAKTLPIEDVPAGSYQLAVRITDPGTGKLTARSVRVIVAGDDQPQPIVITRGTPDTPEVAAADEYARALCWLAQNRPAEARPLLEASFQTSRNPAIGGLLKQLYQRTGQESRPSNVSPDNAKGKQQ